MAAITRAAVGILAGACLAAPARAQAPTLLNEGFDCYQPGALISTLGAWEIWPGGADAAIAGGAGSSGACSLQLGRRAAVVHQFRGYYGRRVMLRAMVFIPAASRGLRAYAITLNQYDGGGPETSWSMQVELDAAAGLVKVRPSGESAPLILDRWVELRAEIRLDRAEFDLYYDGQVVGRDIFWFACPTCPGTDDLAALELFVAALEEGPGMYIDDVQVAPAGWSPLPTCAELCYADCDGSGALDLFDFLCYQALFAAGDALADCSQEGEVTFFDFLCFADAFGRGCG